MAHILSPARKSLRLSLRLSLWLVGVAILPLLLALLMSEVPSRTTLINQASASMITDAKVHAKLIDAYLANKEALSTSLSNDPNVQAFFVDPRLFRGPELQLFIQNGLALEKSLYPEVSLVEFFSPRGELFTYYSLYGNRPEIHGTSLVPPGYLQLVLQGKSFFSGVYYDSRTHVSSSMLYTPVFTSATSHKVVGFVRDTLDLTSLWNIVSGEKGANGSGSYAFLLDQNGVRIIDPDPHTLLSSIAPLTLSLQQQIQNQGLYGLGGQPVPVVADPTLQHVLSQDHTPTSFQEVPADQHTDFQVTWQRLSTIPWLYFTLTPVNTVEAVANQQLLILSLIAFLVLIPVAVIGRVVGRRISSPVIRAVEALKRNSATLNELAWSEEASASEQTEIIDASRVALEAVEYYTRASQGAIQRLNTLGKALPQRAYTVTQPLSQETELLAYIAHYLEKAIDYQGTSNRKVSTAIDLTKKVASELASRARSTQGVANEIDHIVKQLGQTIGKGPDDE